MRAAFEEWLQREVVGPGAEDLINPQHFLAWEQSLPAREREHAEPLPEEARLTGTTGAKKRYNVLPVAGHQEVLWVDPAGYELARSDDELGLYGASHIANDYVLETEGLPTARRVFAGSRRS